jgi:hypothetical protein
VQTEKPPKHGARRINERLGLRLQIFKNVDIELNIWHYKLRGRNLADVGNSTGLQRNLQGKFYGRLGSRRRSAARVGGTGVRSGGLKVEPIPGRSFVVIGGLWVRGAS